MPRFALRFARRTAALLFASVSAIPIASSAQSSPPSFSPITPLAFDNSGPVIRAHTEPLKPFTVAGQRGVLVGQQDGAFA